MAILSYIKEKLQYIVDKVEGIGYNHRVRRCRRLKNKKMKIARMECDLSQEQLAEMVGITRQTISLIESGNYNPTLRLCVEICKALNKTLNDLFWEDET